MARKWKVAMKLTYQQNWNKNINPQMVNFTTIAPEGSSGTTVNEDMNILFIYALEM